MTKSSSSNNNMVESTEKSINGLLKELVKLTASRITAEDIEFDIKELEEEKEFKEMSEKEKIDFLIKNSEKSIRKWYTTLEFELKKTTTTFKKVKEMLIERFGTAKISIADYFNLRQEKEERIEDFVRRIEYEGQRLKQKGEIRLQVVKQGIRNHREVMRGILLGEEEMSSKLLRKMKEAEAFEREKEKEEKDKKKLVKSEKIIKCYGCGKEGHLKRDCKVKGKKIEEIQSRGNIDLNKSDFIYFKDIQIIPTIDTGAEDNYITWPLIKELGINCKPTEKIEKRYTCLGQSFYVRRQADIAFRYREKEHRERFYILPYRKDKSVLLGRKWIQEQLQKKEEKKRAEKEPTTSSHLIKEFCKEKNEGIRGEYECTIETPKNALIAEGATRIPQALQKKVRTEKMAHVDALSRHEQVNRIVNEIVEKQEDNEEKLIKEVHEELIHRGKTAVHEKLKERGYTIELSKIGQILKDCVICKLYNPVKSRATRVVEAYEPGEKVGIDILEMKKGQYIITAIDYFTRKGYASWSKDKNTKSMIKMIDKINRETGIKMLILDSAKENLSKQLRKYLEKNKITHHSTTPYHHQSNGRVERFNRTILQGLNKGKIKGSLHSRIKRIVNAYNETYHRIIEMTPNKAILPENKEIVKRNQFKNRIAEQEKWLKARKWPNYQKGDLVLIREEFNRQKSKPLFGKLAEVEEVREFDTYLLKDKQGRLFKRHASQIKSAGEKKGNVEYYTNLLKSFK